MQKTKQLIALACLAIGSQSMRAQGTVDDYRRAYSIRQTYARKTDNGSVRATAIRDSHEFWYTNWSQQGGTEYTLLNADNNTTRPLFNAEKLKAAISKTTERENVNLNDMERVSVDKSHKMSFTCQGYSFVYDTDADSLISSERVSRRGQWGGPQRHWMEVADEKERQTPTKDRQQVIYVKDNNLWIRPASPRQAEGRPLTTNGDSTYYYSSYGRISPDGKYLATVRIKPAPKRYVYYVESSPADQLQPKLHKLEYTKPGDSLNYRVPVIVEIETGKVIEPTTELFHSQYNVSAPQWDANSQTVTFEFNERGHHTYRLLELSALTGKVRTLIEETDPRYVNYGRLYRHHFEDGKHILWTSERDNYNNIYLYDRQKGSLVRQVTKGGYYVRNIQHVDEKNGIIYFSANGRSGLRASDAKGWSAANSGTGATTEDPYLIHYYKIGLNGKGLTCLTPEEGNHTAVYTDDMQYLIDTYSTITSPPVTVLRSAKDGHIIRTLASADISRLKQTGWSAPEVFVAKGRDGKTDIWGLIQRPSNFDPTKKYPVIEYIYSGPGDQYVPKSFQPDYYYLAPLAELGFIVVQLDGMSTSFRSKEFEAVCYKNLKDSGFPDRIAWIKAAAEKYPYMDADRVGIYGCSAGGQEALGAVLFHGDFYKAAYSACGCHDNRMDKIWWNEQWMSYPIDKSYEESSNVVNAYRLERPLMLVVGELDDNVDPASTMQVVNALQKAGKDFELIVLPGAKHTMGEAFGEHKRYDFFVKNLLGVNPPAWNELTPKRP